MIHKTHVMTVHKKSYGFYQIFIHILNMPNQIHQNINFYYYYYYEMGVTQENVLGNFLDFEKVRNNSRFEHVFLGNHII